MRTIHTLTLILASSISLLAGCATAGKDTLPRGGDMSMAQIYEQETGLSPSYGRTQDIDNARMLASSVGHVSYAQYEKGASACGNSACTLTQARAVNASVDRSSKFKTLSNPEISMYVYPHLVQNGTDAAPVPGYMTAFFLYRENHFALPSEVY